MWLGVGVGGRAREWKSCVGGLVCAISRSSDEVEYRGGGDGDGDGERESDILPWLLHVTHTNTVCASENK